MINNKSEEILTGLIDQKDSLEKSDKIIDFLNKYGVKSVLMRIEVYYEKEYKDYIDNNGIKGVKL